jgi:hypothetical protein
MVYGYFADWLETGVDAAGTHRCRAAAARRYLGCGMAGFVPPMLVKLSLIGMILAQRTSVEGAQGLLAEGGWNTMSCRVMT